MRTLFVATLVLVPALAFAADKQDAKKDTKTEAVAADPAAAATPAPVDPSAAPADPNAAPAATPVDPNAAPVDPAAAAAPADPNAAPKKKKLKESNNNRMEAEETRE